MIWELHLEFPADTFPKSETVKVICGQMLHSAVPL